MRRIKPCIDRAAGISYWEAPEVLGGIDMERYLSDLLGDPDYSVGLQEVIDFKNVRECNLTTDGISRMVIHERAWGDKLIGNQRALICASDLVYGLFRMYTLKSSEVPIEMQVFREADEAAVWMGIDSDEFQALPAMWERQRGGEIRASLPDPTIF